jgi:putative chitinase
MATLLDLVKFGYETYKGLNALPQGSVGVQPVPQIYKGLAVQVPLKTLSPKTEKNSNYYRPLDLSPERLAGTGRGWGQARPETQYQVMDMILQKSKHLSPENQAILLATARIESGFNPDAAATSTSASGVFQLIKKTASNLGVEQKNVFDAEENISAGIKLFEENLAAVNRRFSKLSGNEKAIMLYAFHHDGPGLGYDGAAIARRQMLPYLDDFRAVTYRNAFNEDY